MAYAGSPMNDEGSAVRPADRLAEQDENTGHGPPGGVPDVANNGVDLGGNEVETATQPVTVEPETDANALASSDAVNDVPAAEAAPPSAAAPPPTAAQPEPATVASAPAEDPPAHAIPAAPPAPPSPPGGEADAPPAPRHPDAGELVAGNATIVGTDEVEIELTDGRTGVMNRRNYDPEVTDLSTVLKAMDPIEGAILARDDPKGRVVLSRTWALKKKAWDRVVALAESGEAIGVTIKSANAKGAVADVDGLRGFIPMSQIGLEPGVDPNSLVGNSLEVKVIKADQASDGLVLSRRSLLLREQRKAAAAILSELEAGQVRSGKVVRLEDFGAFVEIAPGLAGLVHISEMSWKRVGHPSDVVSVGDDVKVKILEVKTKKRRVRLSIAQLIEIPVGEVYEGTVTSLQDYGAFVDIGIGEGLVHKTELAEYPVFTPEEVVTPGDVVRVKVLSVDPSRHRIELSIRRAAEVF